MLGFLKEILLPVLCVGCGDMGEFCCRRCLENLSFLSFQECPVCRKPKDDGGYCGGAECMVTYGEKYSFDRLLVAFKYQPKGVLSKLIVQMKYKFSRDAANVLGTAMVYLVQSLLMRRSLGEFVLVPVPLSKKRLRERGFNQAEELAKVVGGRVGLGVVDCLSRSDRIKQSLLTKNARWRNLAGSIEMKSHYQGVCRGKTVILVDDVVTTGATLDVCSRILKESGAKAVWGVVLARGEFARR
ncbi:hypothetical protein CVV38_02250 [Candidatus Peregrinibacteria bacterium HGW-Peregrinibacteria-1]|jgi:ComF family protein|nr:MAG: hypothetical protein CVV38_02250 [Candidatus Peregrinibacteria bacterium HGW-Peregrinibacteria-1]